MTRTDRSHARHPVAVAHDAHRAADVQLRIADTTTAFAGSMRFVYLHAALFVGWMARARDPRPSRPGNGAQ